MSLDEKTKARCDQLFNMGLTFNFDNAYVGSGILSDVNVPLLDIRLDDDVKWERNMRRLQKEIDRRKALPPLDIITVHNRGGSLDTLASHYGVDKEDVHTNLSLSGYWTTAIRDARQSRKGSTLLIITQAMNAQRVKTFLELNADEPEMAGVKFILVCTENMGVP